MDRSFGERIRAIREALRLTQQEFADLLGVTRQQVIRWEHGRQATTQARLMEICEKLGITLAEFWDPDWHPHSAGEGKGGGLPLDRPRTFDPDGRARPCPNCGEDRYGDRARYCPMCGWALFNFCIAAERHVNRPEANRCEECGKPTWWSFDSQDEIDRLDIPDDARSSRILEVAPETT